VSGGDPQAPSTPRGEAALVALARDGSDTAFEAIVARYTPQLRRRCRTLLPAHDVDDALQLTLIRALVALRAGAEVVSLGPWLHRIARNVALTELARERAGAHPLSDACEDYRHSDELERRADVRAALAAVATLPARQRAVLARAASGESHASIARDFGVSEVALRQLLRRARVSLRARVSGA